MSDIIFTIFVCFAAGCHAASYGAYKDSPHESFLIRRCFRELVIASSLSFLFIYFHVYETENYLIIYLSTFTISRLITEFFKLNLRVEPQDNFRIPTQIHLLGRVVQNKIIRILLGLVTPSAVFAVYLISVHLPDSINNQLRGIIIGFIIGVADASGGAYKDGLIEGFYLKKFLKSPICGALGGFVISFRTSSPLFHLLGTIAIMRMLIELLFKILDKKYVPGKFKSMVPIYPEWSKKRKKFLVPYAMTWIVCIVLYVLV